MNVYFSVLDKMIKIKPNGSLCIGNLMCCTGYATYHAIKEHTFMQCITRQNELRHVFQLVILK